MPPKPPAPPAETFQPNPLQPASWLATPLTDVPTQVQTALSQGMTAPQVWALCCALLGPDTPVVPLDSFTLHAPLELLARWQLLPLLDRADRPLALLQMVYTAVRAAQARHAVALQHPEAVASIQIAPGTFPTDTTPTDTNELHAAIGQALDAGDVQAATRLALQLVSSPAPAASLGEQLARWARLVRNRMGASAHVPIALQLLARLHAHAPADAALACPMLVPLLAELARQPERTVSWPDTFATQTAPGTPPLLALLARQTRVAEPDCSGIWPMVNQTLRDGAHLAWLPGVDKAGVQALPIACRAAAWSMLQEPLDDARYGWTHALTLPQAWWALARLPDANEYDVRTAARLATLHLAAMRRVIGQTPLNLQPPPAAISFEACARIASMRADAHAVKYVLACIDAAHASPADAALYRAAATRLCQHWADSVPEARILHSLAER